jgi:hypothetical protein
METVDRFGSDGNISCFADQLRWETAPHRREVLKRLLIQEEDRLGATDERLRMVERKLEEGAELIARQRRLIARLQSSGGDARTAERALDTYEMIQDLFENFRAVLHDAKERRLQHLS